MARWTDSANYEVVEDAADRLVIRDLGPWNMYKSVTNAAEEVVGELASRLRGRRLFYYDSAGTLDEIVVREGRFSGFRPGPNGGK